MNLRRESSFPNSLPAGRGRRMPSIIVCSDEHCVRRPVSRRRVFCLHQERFDGRQSLPRPFSTWPSAASLILCRDGLHNPFLESPRVGEEGGNRGAFDIARPSESEVGNGYLTGWLNHPVWTPLRWSIAGKNLTTLRMSIQFHPMTRL